ncbi:TUP1-like enhancer of split-domain-containing protein [Lipomyces tetrasporus]|uniref:Protein HIR n=1 Tax=Lipomyces tetrasporus TaxID=54092 RepID=A0AAD7VRF8_9ASCO|nr:TUP1-like enhancer of split-domain-containing protein [Lipomyces tetrasporus]KAJ8098604.1 TUP1-like enhancer of split-domain-containing protein [Lipomyces tetrasporus]
MYYLKPSWLTHSEGQKHFEVYSIHVSPDGDRLASGGLDSKVRIWSTQAIYACAAVEGTENVANGNGKAHLYTGPRQLCSMSTHSGAVTVVRFSPSGRYLASGSDDRVILVWEREEEGHELPRKEFGSQGETDSERWLVRRRCVGHDNDVQDLAWAPDSSILVSVGLDSGIIVWSGTTFEKIKRLDIHQSHVKGITFDPANKYFATASDDRTIKIVRYHRTSATDMTFALDTTVTAPFEGSPLTTYFRRCSWSPDGSHIAAANATNGPVATVAIVNRGVWDSEINLIGHEGPVEVAAFSPRMFAKAKGSKQLVTVIACAGQDKALSVWNTSNPRPIVVSQDIAEKAITDLAWAPDGQKVFASSLDGSILVCTFEEGDLGYIIPVEENEKQLAKYGGGRDAMHFPESVEQLALEEKSNNKETDQGKRRLTDLMEGKATSTNGASAAISAGSATIGSRSSTSSTFAAPSANAGADVPVVTTAQPVPPLQRQAQKVMITKEGRKRVAPMLVSGSSSVPSASTQPVVSTTGTPNHEGPMVEYTEPSNKLPPGGIQTLVVGNKRKLQLDGQDGSDAKRLAAEVETPEFVRPAVLSPAITFSQVRLATPKVKTLLSTDDGGSSVVFEVRNGAGGEKEPTRITLQRKGQLLWSNFVPKMVLLVAGNTSFWAVACEDATIHIYSPTGRALAPTIVLESTPSFLDAAGKYLMCLSSTGTLNIWNMLTMTSPHPPVSVAPVLDAAVYSDSGLHKSPSITKCVITAVGSVVITLTNGDGYTYSPSMYAWQRVSESWWAVASQYWDSSGMHSTGGTVGVIERRTDEELKRAGKGRALQRMVKSAMMREGYEGIETTVSIAHLENRIGAAILLGSKKEFQTYMMMYARRLAEEGLKDRLEELFKELLGPMEGGTYDLYEATICGIDKKELLKEIIIAVGKQREVQRVSVPYAKLLGILDDNAMDTD